MYSLQVAVLLTMVKRAGDGVVESLPSMHQSLRFEPQHHIAQSGLDSASCLKPSTQRWKQKDLQCSVMLKRVVSSQPLQDTRQPGSTTKKYQRMDEFILKHRTTYKKMYL